MENIYYTNITEELLRSQLIELALTYKLEKLFYDMTGDNWREHLVCPKKAAEYIYTEKNIERIDSFLVKKYRDEVDNTLENIDDYIKKTIITDEYEDKRATLHQLMVFSKTLGKDIFDFINKIYNDEQLVNLLTLTSDKKYRNAVFYLDKERETLLLKDERAKIKESSISEALEYYRNNNEQFFIEIKMVESI